MPSATSDPTTAVRRFNRFYTRQIGLLDEGLLDSPFSLTEVRLLYEIAHHAGITATELRETLAIDAGYLSRLLRGLRRQGLVSARAPAADRRRRRADADRTGRPRLRRPRRTLHRGGGAMLARLSRPERRELVEAMHGIEGLLGKAADRPGGRDIQRRAPRAAAGRAGLGGRAPRRAVRRRVRLGRRVRGAGGRDRGPIRGGARSSSASAAGSPSWEGSPPGRSSW